MRRADADKSESLNRIGAWAQERGEKGAWVGRALGGGLNRSHASTHLRREDWSMVRESRLDMLPKNRTRHWNLGGSRQPHYCRQSKIATASSREKGTPTSVAVRWKEERCIDHDPMVSMVVAEG